MTLEGDDAEAGHAREEPELTQASRGDFAPGSEVAGRYVIRRLLGLGGMGAVYEAVDDHLEEEVALKLLHPRLSSDRDYRQRLRSEVRLARRVSHPNVCRVHDLGQHAGQLFVTMELVRGPSLRRLLKDIRAGTRAPLPLAQKIDIMVQVCAALAAAHRAGVLHRDVKPDNVLVEDDRAVLTDFGVAALSRESNARVIAGTPAYIAPEVLRGDSYDHRVDVYACAVVAYELIAGRQPFATPSLDAAITRARGRPELPPLPEGCAPPAALLALDRMLSHALSFDLDARTPSADALAEHLAEAARGARWVSAAQDPAVAQISTAATLPPSAAPTAPTLLGTPSPAPASAFDTPGPRLQSRAAGASGSLERRAARSMHRVATVLCFRCTGSDEGTADTMVGVDATLSAVTLLTPADRLERLVVDLGGTPVAVSPGEIIALFGAPVALGDDAVRAARAARALIERTQDGRAGIATGRVLYRARVGGPPQVSGEAFERARRLGDDAAPAQVLVTAATARQLAGRFGLDDAPGVGPDGERALVLGDPGAGADDAQAWPMVGRERELGALEELIFAACETRTPRYAQVHAAAGLGKSRLRVELARRVGRRREIEWLLGRAAPLGEVAPLAVIRSASADWFDAAVRAGLDNRPAALAAARRWLEHRAARRPVVVLLEDMQWADEASQQLLAELRTGLRDVPVAVVCFARPHAPVAPMPGSERIELAPLREGEAAQVARRIAPAATDDEIAELVARAGGSPFFIVELARDLRERTPRPRQQLTPLPATVEAVVQARLDRLPPAARELVCAAAVVGREFWRDAARAGLADPDTHDEAGLDDALFELERRGIIAALPPTQVDDERYAFDSALVRDVAYQQLERRDRRRAHAQIARWLARRAGSLARAEPSTLAAIARHRDLGGDARGACDAYREAGKRALALFAYREAASALRRAEELADPPDATLHELVGDAAQQAESMDAAEASYRAALDALDAEGGGDPLVRANLWRKLGLCASGRADNAAAVDAYERGLAIVAPGGTLTTRAEAEPTVAADLFGSLGWILGYQMSDNERGLSHSERAVALLEDTPHRRELARALSRLGGNYMRAGRFQDQLRCNRANLAIAEELRDLHMQLTANLNLGVNYGTLGDIELAITHTRRALALSGRTGAATTEALIRSNLAGLLVERVEDAVAAGDPAAQAAADAEADRLLDEAMQLADDLGYRRFLPEAHQFRARLRFLAGDVAGAERSARRAVAIAESTGLVVDEAIAARVLGAILSAGGAHDEALALMERSRHRLHGHDPYEDARTAAARARVLRLRDAPGDAGHARVLQAEARAVFEQLGTRRELALLDQDRVVR